MINLDLGVKEYPIETENGKYTIKFNPTDIAMLNRITDLIETIANKGKELNINEENKNSTFEKCIQYDKYIRTELDQLFGENLCDTIFGQHNLNASSNGFPLWLNFVLAVVDEFDKGLLEEKNKVNPRLEGYLKKYKK